MKVSIICTSYNKAPWLEEAIESFLVQETDFPVEIILVDDASTDQSAAIIADYQKRYPEQIRSFFNPTNQGITKTWLFACEQAKGQYIARCDGDDYWTDPYKLSKQVALLEQTSSSLWSNTDFDMVDNQGNLLQSAVLANKYIPVVNSYEHMLAVKGMTMSSTWLVDRELMLEVNQLISPEATDDTFNLQLELFRRTKLTTLEDSTTVYRMVGESDSRTNHQEKLEKRLTGLYETQCEYVQKYPDCDLAEVVRQQAFHDSKQEFRIFQLSNHVSDLLQEIKHQKNAREVERQVAREAYAQLLEEHHRVIGSRRWIILTKIINFFRRTK